MRVRSTFSERRDRRSAGRFAALRAALLAVVIVNGTIACGAPLAEPDEIEAGMQRVRPRVVLDGLIELSARTEGRVFVDEVIIHAPEVELLDDGMSTDVLASDPADDGPLLFRYSTDTASSTCASAHQRTWDLTDFGRSADSALLFSFSPFAGDRDQLEELEARLGYDLGELSGYTAVISGYVATELPESASPLANYSASGDPDGAPAHPTDLVISGDPDGAPAQPTDLVISGDPDGAPARPDDFASSGDPDGAPARPDDFASSGDPDGAPASGDPDGAPASGDPDGAPASGDDDEEEDEDGNSVESDEDLIIPTLEDLTGGHNGALASGDPDGAPAKGPTQDRFAGSFGPNTSALSSERYELRPFVIVFDSRFDLKIPAATVAHKDLASGGERIVPIDLHVDTDALFSERVLELLDASTSEHEDATHPAVVVLEAGSTNFEVAAEIPVELPEDIPGIGGNPLLVTGDARGN